MPYTVTILSADPPEPAEGGAVLIHSSISGPEITVAIEDLPEEVSAQLSDGAALLTIAIEDLPEEVAAALGVRVALSVGVVDLPEAAAATLGVRSSLSVAVEDLPEEVSAELADEAARITIAIEDLPEEVSAELERLTIIGVHVGLVDAPELVGAHVHAVGSHARQSAHLRLERVQRATLDLDPVAP